jgi:hypothetical protein
MKNIFNKVAKGVAKGAGIAFVAAAILPVVSVSWPVLLIGGGIGGAVAYKKNKGPKNG